MNTHYNLQEMSQTYDSNFYIKSNIFSKFSASTGNLKTENFKKIKNPQNSVLSKSFLYHNMLEECKKRRIKSRGCSIYTKNSKPIEDSFVCVKNSNAGKDYNLHLSKSNKSYEGVIFNNNLNINKTKPQSFFITDYLLRQKDKEYKENFKELTQEQIQENINSNQIVIKDFDVFFNKNKLNSHKRRTNSEFLDKISMPTNQTHMNKTFNNFNKNKGLYKLTGTRYKSPEVIYRSELNSNPFQCAIKSNNKSIQNTISNNLSHNSQILNQIKKGQNKIDLENDTNNHYLKMKLVNSNYSKLKLKFKDEGWRKTQILNKIHYIKQMKQMERDKYEKNESKKHQIGIKEDENLFEKFNNTKKNVISNIKPFKMMRYIKEQEENPSESIQEQRKISKLNKGFISSDKKMADALSSFIGKKEAHNLINFKNKVSLLNN
jgi:hypothetical protein